jgi:dihydrofolate reductase
MGRPYANEASSGRVRNVIFSMTTSLDGYIAGPDEDPGWAAPDEELHRFHNEQTRELGLHLLGRRLYEVMTYWETAEERSPASADYELEFARIWKELPKIVYSTTLETVEGKTQLSRADPVEEVREMKQQSGADIAVGGATLASTLTAAGLVDEYRIFVAPAVLGSGKPFFAGDTRLDAELIETRTFGSGVVYLRYRRA